MVSRLNDEELSFARIEDVAAVEDRVIEWAEPYFRDMYRKAPAAAVDARPVMAQGGKAPVDLSARRWLDQQYLLAADERLAVPILGRGIAHHGFVESLAR